MFKGKSLGFKIAVGFLVMVLIQVVIVGVSLLSIKDTQTITDRVINLRAPSVLASTDLINGVNHSLAALRGFIILKADKFVDERAKAWEAIDEHIVEMDGLSKKWTNTENIQRYQETKKLLGEFRGYQGEAETLVKSDPASAEINQILGTKAAPTAFKIKELLGQIIENQKKMMAEDTDAAHAANNRLVLTEWILLALGVLVSIALGLLITRSITKPIDQIINSLNEGSSQVASASTQISTASQALASGATQQAASLEETSASLEEISAMTGKNADNARNANNRMTEGLRLVEDGSSSMEAMVNAMRHIDESSKEISKIIKVIEEIAFQTNLLALNAAVEAARAGEHGKGFAVVAEEVRNLAQRSATASKDTARLIENAVSKTAEGSAIVAKLSESLTSINGSIREVSGLVSEIATASNEQSTGVSQVTQAVTQMDQVTQANAATAEESASASEELNAQAENLHDMVNELVALVRGSEVGAAFRRSGAVHHEAPRHQASAPARKAPALPAPRAAAKPQAKTAFKAAPRAGESKPVAAEEVIPFGDDDFKDF